MKFHHFNPVVLVCYTDIREFIIDFAGTSSLLVVPHQRPTIGPFDLRLMSLQAVVNLLVFDTISRININLDPSLIKVGNAR